MMVKHLPRIAPRSVRFQSASVCGVAENLVAVQNSVIFSALRIYQLILVQQASSPLLACWRLDDIEAKYRRQMRVR
jgi:hypothetical protein